MLVLYAIKSLSFPDWLQLFWLFLQELVREVPAITAATANNNGRLVAPVKRSAAIWYYCD